MKKFTLSVITMALFFSIPTYANNTEKIENSNKNNKRIEKIDTDGDGLLSKKELLFAHRERIKKMFSKFDKDKDGKLSREELRASRKGMKKKHYKGKEKCDKNNV